MVFMRFGSKKLVDFNQSILQVKIVPTQMSLASGVSLKDTFSYSTV
jgi:hypothetical protein